MDHVLAEWCVFIFTKDSLLDKSVSHHCAFAGEEAALQTQDVHTAPLYPLVYCAGHSHILRRLIHVVFGKACGRYISIQSALHSSHSSIDYAAKSWRVRWWLLDGWLGLLYLTGFVLIAFLWRPSENNRR